MRIASRRGLLFATITATIYASALLVVSRMPAVESPERLAIAVLIDLVIVVPALYWLLFLRGTGRPFGLALVFLLSLAGAALVLPPEYRGLVPRARLLAFPAELAITLYVVWLARRLYGDHDPGADVLERLRHALRGVAPARVADVIAYEIGVLYYALLAWRDRRADDGHAIFTQHRRASYGSVVAALVLASVAEIVTVHLLVAHWSRALAWGLSGLAAYGVLWLFVDYQALRLRPILVDESALHLRLGVRWSAEVPLASIRAVTTEGLGRLTRKMPGYLHAVVMTSPKVVLHVEPPVVARGPYGITKHVSRIGLAPDERARFADLLRARASTERAEPVRQG